MLLERSVEIDTAMGAQGRDTPARLREIFDGAQLEWPAYDVWVISLKNRGKVNCGFGPLLKPMEPRDFLSEASFETLRRIARDNGVKPKRSKLETAERLTSEIDPLLLREAAAEGEARWSKYILEPYLLTPFAVLQQTINMASVSAGDIASAVFIGLKVEGFRWITGDTALKCDDCAALNGVLKSYDLTLAEPDEWPPRHPGCYCGFITVWGDL